MPQITGLQYPVHALTIRGHCMYVNAPFCLCREWWVPRGLPVLWLHLPGYWVWAQASGVTMQDTCTALSPPAHTAVRGGMSQQPHPLLGLLRGAQGMQPGTKIFVPVSCHMWRKKDNNSHLSHLFGILSHSSLSCKNTYSSFSQGKLFRSFLL